MQKILSPQEQFTELKRGVIQIESSEDLLAKLQKSYQNNQPLKVKAGFDPTRPDLHLGHVVLLNKMKQFQDFGHEVIFLIGDFTAYVGDPTGKNETRPPLEEGEIQQNAQTYAKQVFKVLDKDKTQIRYNTEWMSKLSAIDFIKLMSKYTLSRMAEKHDFKKRLFSDDSSIAFHELIYPLLQGYDSVVLKSDIELGGTDQIFNLLVGRKLQKSYGQPSQCVLTLPLLEGLDGVKKMSKSYNNFIALDTDAKDMFGKIMRLSDDLMVKYYELLTDITMKDLTDLKNKKGRFALENPRDTKVRLAKMLATRFYSKEDADQAHQEFVKVFSKGGQPDDIKEFVIKQDSIWICRLLVESQMVSSTSEAKRLIRSRAVKKNGVALTDETEHISLAPGDSFVLKVGKRRFAKIARNN